MVDPRFARLDDLLTRRYCDRATLEEVRKEAEQSGVSRDAAMHLAEALDGFWTSVNSARDLQTQAENRGPTFQAVVDSADDTGPLDSIERSYGMLLGRVGAAYRAAADLACRSTQMEIAEGIREASSDRAWAGVDVNAPAQLDIPAVRLKTRSRKVQVDVPIKRHNRLSRRRHESRTERRLELPSTQLFTNACKIVSESADRAVSRFLIEWCREQLVHLAAEEREPLAEAASGEA